MKFTFTKAMIITIAFLSLMLIVSTLETLAGIYYYGWNYTFYLGYAQVDYGARLGSSVFIAFLILIYVVAYKRIKSLQVQRGA